MKNASLYFVDDVVLNFDDVLSFNFGCGHINLLCYDSEYSFRQEDIKEIKFF